MLVGTTNLLEALPAPGRARLMAFALDVSFPAGERITEEGGQADRFWVIRTGSVRLDLRVGMRPSAVVETLSPGDLIGWDWLFPPYEWHLGAETLSPVRALEFDAEAARALCDEDPLLGRAITQRVAEIVAHRLQRTRTRLLELYGPHALGVPA
ncbi:MAG TPA: cyclic nucleotide-binding domain-containing protein [Streptomyces sp.]|jgi:CRP-like cAMP-binding protein|nr:cyclic nucleotide-binding domain-containing protein [Streptomyces sp.]